MPSHSSTITSALLARASSAMDSRLVASATTLMSRSWSITARNAVLSIGKSTIASMTPRRAVSAPPSGFVSRVVVIGELAAQRGWVAGGLRLAGDGLRVARVLAAVVPDDDRPSERHRQHEHGDQGGARRRRPPCPG